MRILRHHLPWSGIIHLVSALLAAVGAVYLICATPPASTARIAAVIYGAALTFLFSASTAADLSCASEKWALRLRKIDHSAIFVFIAASYTPVCLLYLTGAARIALLTSVWILALAGVVYKLWVFHAPRWVSTLLYLGLGWMALPAIGTITSKLSGLGNFWLFAGAALYTVGALIFASRKCDFWPGTFGNHEVWHLFVSAASASHFVLIAWFVLPA